MIQHTVRYTELAPARFKDFWNRSRPVSSVKIALILTELFAHRRNQQCAP